MILSAAVLCLSLNVYHEARGEPVLGQRWVAHVTLNRRDKNKKTVCETVLEPYQFSWTLKPHNIDINLLYSKYVIIAKNALCNKDITNGATHFYNPKKASPTWAREKQPLAVIGNHTFYRL